MRAALERRRRGGQARRLNVQRLRLAARRLAPYHQRMALIALRDVSLGFRGPLVLDRVNLTIEPGERVCLLGRNGTGKTTLLRLIQGEIEPDRGRNRPAAGARHRHASAGSAAGAQRHGLRRGRPRIGAAGRTAGRVSPRGRTNWPSKGATNCRQRLDRIQHALEIDGGWSMHQEVEAILSRMSLEPTPTWPRSRPA